MDMDKMIAEARQFSGEQYVGSRPQFPTIKFMGRESKYGEAGKFYRLEKSKDTNELVSTLIGDSCEVTILRVRKMLDNGEDGEARKFVYEFDTTMPGAIVVMKIGTNEPIEISYADVRQQHPDMKYIEVLYVMYGGAIHKLKVSGGSLKNLFEYFRSFPYTDTMMRYKTLLGGEKITHAKGDYCAITFTKGAEDPAFEQYLTDIKKLSFPTPPVSVLPAPKVDEGEARPGEEHKEGGVEEIPF